MTLTLATLNAASASEFAALLGGIYEHSPWIAEHAALLRPFASVAALRQALIAVVRDASGLDDYLAALDARFDQPIDIGGKRLRIGASIGMARSEDFPGAPSRLIQAADIALYRAKRNGPGNAELAIPSVPHAA